MAFFKHNRHRKKIIAAIILLVLLFGGFIYVKYAFAYACVWSGGGGADTNWSTPANWTSCNSTYPQSGDTVTFNSTSDNNSTVDSGWGGTISQVSISSGYDGTITMARSLTVSSTFTQGAGSFTAADQTLTVTGTFSLSAGSFTASSGTTTFNSSITISGSPTFDANGGTINFNGNNSFATLACNNTVFNLVTINKSGLSTTTIGSDCSLPLGASPTITYSSATCSGLNINGTLSGSGTLTINGASGACAPITFGNTAVLSGFSGLNVTPLLSPFTTSATTLDLGAYTTVNFSGPFVLSSGTFTAPSGTMTMGGNFTNTSGTFNANGGTVNINGAGSQTTVCTSATLFNLITLSGGGIFTFGTNCTAILSSSVAISSFTSNGIITFENTSFTFNGALTISGGSFTAPSGTMSVAGSFTISGSPTFDANGGTINFNGNNSFATLACNNTVFNLVTINKSGLSTTTIGSDCSLPLGASPTITYSSATCSGLNINGTLSGSGTLTINGASGACAPITFGNTAVLSGFSGLNVTPLLSPFTTSATTLDLGAYTTVNFSGPFVLSSGTFTAPSAGMTFSGTFTNNGTFNGSSGTITFNSTFTNNNGKTFTASSTTTTFKGNFTNSGTFDANGGTVVFNGASSQTIAGATTFNNLTVTGTYTKTFTFPASTTTTIANSLTLRGTGSGNKMLVRSSSNGVQALLNVNGPNDLQWIDVKDSDACSGHSLVANVSTNSLNNTCWTFQNNGVKNPTFIQRGVTIQQGVTISGT